MTLRLRTVLLLTLAAPAAAQQIVPADLGLAVIDRPYRVVMRIQMSPGVFYNGEVIWKLTGGTLPIGVTFASSEGSIGGTPIAPGSFPITVEAVIPGLNQILTRNFTVTVNPELRIASPAALPLGVVGEFLNVVFIAEGGKPPFVWDLVPPPLGLTFTPAGGLSGTPTAPLTMQTRLRLTDADGFTLARDYTFEVVAERPSPIVSDLERIVIDPSKSIAPAARLTATAAKDRSFTVAIESSRGGDAPTWIRANLTAGRTPAEVTVTVDRAAMPSASETGTLILGETRIPFEVTATTPAPPLAGAFQREWLDGTGAASFGISIDNPSDTAVPVQASGTAPWVTVTPANATIPAHGTLNLTAAIDGSKVKPGGQLGAVRVDAGSSGVADLLLPVFGGRGQTQIAVSSSGLTFHARPGQGSAQAQAVDVLALSGTVVNWSAELISGQESFRLRSAGGVSTKTQSSQLVVEVRSDAAPSQGTYYGLVRVTAPGSSEQYVTLILSATAELLPELQLVPGGTANTYTARVLSSSTAGTQFRLAANSLDGGSWLTASASTGTSSSAAPGSVSVVAASAGLTAGVYTGWVSVTADNARVRSLPVRLVIPAANCTTPSALVLTPSAPASGFAARAGWPVRIEARLIDDCVRNVSDAVVTAYFSNGDAPVRLRATSSSAGTYAASWIPGNAAQNVGITVRAVRGSLRDSMQLWGSAAANPGAPVFYTNGGVNNLNPVPGAPLAGGTIIALYGAAMTEETAAAASIPLPTTLAGVRVLANTTELPLFYASPGQINAQWAAGLDPAHWHSLVVRSGSAITLPQTVMPAAASPGLAALPDGVVIAQHADYSLVSAAAPARLDETITLYLGGMGATNPPVGTGQVSPVARVNTAPTVTIDGLSADIEYAGLTPEAIGLYQINCKVPLGARAGESEIVVIQDGVASNRARIFVRRD